MDAEQPHRLVADRAEAVAARRGLKRFLGQKNRPGVDPVRGGAGLLSLFGRRPHQHDLKTQVLRPLGVVALVGAEVLQRFLERSVLVPQANSRKTSVRLDLTPRGHSPRPP